MLPLINDSDVIIITGGQEPSAVVMSLLKSMGLPIIVADSGANFLAKYNMVANYAIGDFDSIDSLSILDKIDSSCIYAFKCDKDASDSALALSLAYKKGFKRALLVGGGAKRSDHFLANLLLMKSTIAPAYWITAHELMVVMTQTKVLKVENGQTLSFYALLIPMETKSDGLKWPLDAINWSDITTMSLSNRTCSDNIVVRIQSGRLLMLMPYYVEGDYIKWV